jgi:NADP-dependent 3-hydroxy acid dehydrogenase YdfG
MNVQDAKSVEAMVSFVVEQYGRLDYCVNAAGVSETSGTSKSSRGEMGVSSIDPLVHMVKIRYSLTGCIC